MAKAFAIFLIVCLYFTSPFGAVFANESYVVGTVSGSQGFRWNNENWFTAKHPRIASFTVRSDGSAFGMTETGVTFTQDNVLNDAGIRIQRFVMEDHYHYIIDGEVVYTAEELSARLARALGTATSASNA